MPNQWNLCTQHFWRGCPGQSQSQGSKSCSVCSPNQAPLNGPSPSKGGGGAVTWTWRDMEEKNTITPQKKSNRIRLPAKENERPRWCCSEPAFFWSSPSSRLCQWQWIPSSWVSPNTEETSCTNYSLEPKWLRWKFKTLEKVMTSHHKKATCYRNTTLEKNLAPLSGYPWVHPTVRACSTWTVRWLDCWRTELLSKRASTLIHLACLQFFLLKWIYVVYTLAIGSWLVPAKTVNSTCSEEANICVFF